MCGFLVTSSKVDDLKFLKGFERIKRRGPDEEKVLMVGEGLFGFHRLSIMDLSSNGMQPFIKNNDVVVCNGEFYNYQTLIEQYLKDYSFDSSSDCEMILPMYERFGLEMFSMFDAEFALVLFDSKCNKYIAGRDPMGIRPMFYGYGSDGAIHFASEGKALIGFVDQVIPFPPGHYYDGETFICYSDLLEHKDYLKDSKKEVLKNINEFLTNAVVKRLHADAKIGYLLSGGLDSSLVCSIASKFSEGPIKTFAIGMDTDPIDLKYAKDVADYLKSDHTEVIMTKEEVLENLREIIFQLETYDITTIRASVGMYLICKYIRRHTDIKVLLTGEVSDELFGYKYTDFAPDSEAFQKESIKRIEELYMYDVLRADRCLASHSLEARVPFSDYQFAKYVLTINPYYKMNRKNIGKHLLRKAFEGDYLPHHILYREKAAFSDAVGHSMVDCIKAYAESKYTDEAFLKIAKRYKNPTPISKEALLYREIFETYYSDHSHLILDYWMPNKEWEGCNVDDPSARVLSNYGKSGE